MFPSLHAISAKISPEAGSSGIELLETDTFNLHCFQSLTGLAVVYISLDLQLMWFLGIKFLITEDKQPIQAQTLLRKIYELYADYALKNPFYTPEMPIRCELFDGNLMKLMQQSSA